MEKIAQSPKQFKVEESKLRLLMSNVTGLVFDVLNKTYGDEARGDAGPGTLRLKDALAELEFTFRCLEHEDTTLQLLKLRMGKDQLFADFFPKFIALINRGARTCHGTCEDDRSKKLALQACLPARFGNIVKKYVTEDHGSFKEFVDECFASEGWTKTPEPPRADTTMSDDDVVCVSQDGFDNPDWFNSEDRKISHLMQHVTSLAFDVLGKKYCHSARQEARESHETLTFQVALSDLDVIFRRIDPLEATSEMQQLYMTEEDEFPDFLPKFMALINRGAYTSRGNSDQASDTRKLGTLALCFDDAHFRNGVASRLSPGSTFEEYVDECFRFACLWNTSPWSSETHSPASSTQGSSGRMVEDVAE
ncbi:hypothetical protein IWX90DRAFT_487299 [Phyllosticta citrichinensis]|uniref:Uncharacterized protein n=1 Tax=Phyllosticta citrichinensis TaxID=1130410 RepID=A0ABR1XQP4_9PEZI